MIDIQHRDPIRAPPRRHVQFITAGRPALSALNGPARSVELSSGPVEPDVLAACEKRVAEFLAFVGREVLDGLDDTVDAEEEDEEVVEVDSVEDGDDEDCCGEEDAAAGCAV